MCSIFIAAEYKAVRFPLHRLPEANRLQHISCQFCSAMLQQKRIGYYLPPKIGRETHLYI